MTDDKENLYHTSVNVYGNIDRSGCEIRHSDHSAGTRSTGNNRLRQILQQSSHVRLKRTTPYESAS